MNYLAIGRLFYGLSMQAQSMKQEPDVILICPRCLCKIIKETPDGIACFRCGNEYPN